MLFFHRNIIANITNTTSLGRLTFNLCSLVFVFLAGYYYASNETSKIFNILAIVKAGSSLASFGFGPSALKILNEFSITQRSKVVLNYISLKLLSIIIISFLIKIAIPVKGLDYWIVFFALFGSSWNFSDFYVELFSKKDYINYFKFKALFSIICLTVKLIFIYFKSPLLYYILTIEGLFAFSHIIITCLNKTKGYAIFHYSYFKDLTKVIKYSFSIWISSFIQLGGSRIVYLVIDAIVPKVYSSLYYIIMRSIEGLAFVPNNICAQIFGKILMLSQNSPDQKKLRKKMLHYCVAASFFMAPLLFVVLIGFFKIKGIPEPSKIFLFLFVASLTTISFFRVWLSREIVINENLVSSPLGYTMAFIVSIPVIYLLSTSGEWIILNLLLYFGVISTAPLLINKNRMKTTIKLILER